MSGSNRSNIGAYILIAVGAFFLVTQVFNISLGSIFNLSWPLFIIIPGALFLLVAVTGDRRMAGFAVPGALITGTGAILWYQNTTDHWESWAYVWTLYPVFVGLALSYMARRTDNAEMAKTGSGFIKFGLIAFLVGAAFFELILFDGMTIGRWVVPAVLILAGGYLLLRGRPLALYGEKSKRIEGSVFTGAVDITKPKNGASPIDRDLQRKIDEALAEDETPTDSK